jgi:hypothetical protein
MIVPGVLALLAMPALAAPATAHAYRTFADDPAVGVAARRGDSTLRWDLYAPPEDESADAVERAATQAYSTWSAPDCTSFFAEGAGRAASPAAPGDGRNTIEIVRSGWGARGFPAGRGATTDVQLQVTEDYGVRQAEIVEADIYLNFESFEFSAADSTPPGALDLLGVLVHEIGHQAISLRHPCEISAAGEPVCEVLPEARLSAMYPEYLGASQRVLATDDVSGVCDLYPREGCPLSCGIGNRCVEMVACEACSAGDCAPECSGPACTPDPGVSCGPAAACERGECASFYGDMGLCAVAGALGTPCVIGAECVTGLCLIRREDAPTEPFGYCTSRCGTSTDCSEGQVCGADNVCRPPPQPSCSATAGRARPTGWMVMVLLFGACVRRRSLVSRRK